MKKTSLIILLSVHYLAANTDILIFSFDRPLQLYALLESIECYVKGVVSSQVIYRSSSEEFDKGYDIVKEKFTLVHFIKQTNPPHDFKALTEHAIVKNKNAPYILFAVDDIIVTDYVDLNECAQQLEANRAYGFYLRVGLNITTWYPTTNPLPQPHLKAITSDIYSWKLSEGQLYWGYPHTVDMTLYRKKDIIRTIRQIPYHSPNLLEGTWCGAPVPYDLGLCYARSKMVNIPLNIVNRDKEYHKQMHWGEPLTLLKILTHGLKIDIQKLYKINNDSPHFHISPELVDRTA